MDANELRALADALEPMAKAPRFEGMDVPAFCRWLRACADALPVALVRAYNAGYMAGHHDTVEGGFVDIPPSEMYPYPADVVAELGWPAARQAEPKLEPLSADEILDIATAAGLQISMYIDDVETRAAIKRLARAIERAHGIGGSDE